MSQWANSATPSGASGASRMQRAAPESSLRWDLEEYPLGEESGLPLVPCPDCGMARVIERRSANEKTKNYLRVFFKCPRNGFNKLCGFYKFQREYLEKLKELGIVTVLKFPPAVEIGGEIGDEAAVGDATSRRTDKNMTVGEKEAKLEAKMEDLMWKFNMLMFVFAVVLGCVFTYLVVAVK